VFDAHRGVLTFPALLPHVDSASALAADLRHILASRSGRQQPAHKRVDARRARLSGGVRYDNWSLAVHIRGANHEYAVRLVLNVINETFVVLQDKYPEYLAEHFGLSTE
jgi:hypothetical protein